MIYISMGSIISTRTSELCSIFFFNICHPEVFNIYIRKEVSVKHNKTLLRLLLY